MNKIDSSDSNIFFLCVSVERCTFLASFVFGPSVLYFSAAIDWVCPRAALCLKDAQLASPRLTLSAALPSLVCSPGRQNLGWFVDSLRTFHHCSWNFCILRLKHTNASQIFSLTYIDLKTVVRKVSLFSWRHFAAVISASVWPSGTDNIIFLIKNVFFMLFQIYSNYSQSFIIYGKRFKQIASAAFPAVASLKAQCVGILRLENILEMNVLCHGKMKSLNQCASILLPLRPPVVAQSSMWAL